MLILVTLLLIFLVLLSNHFIILFIIQDRVGHENSKMLEQFYLYITKEAKLNLNSQLEKL